MSAKKTLKSLVQPPLPVKLQTMNTNAERFATRYVFFVVNRVSHSCNCHGCKRYSCDSHVWWYRHFRKFFVCIQIFYSFVGLRFWISIKPPLMRWMASLLAVFRHRITCKRLPTQQKTCFANWNIRFRNMRTSSLYSFFKLGVGGKCSFQKPVRPRQLGPSCW